MADEKDTVIISLFSSLKQKNDTLIRVNSMERNDENITQIKKIIKEIKDIIENIKELYIENIKKFTYNKYEDNDLNEYSIKRLQEIYINYKNNKCNFILKYDGNNSCYLDSLFVSLFNTKNSIIKKILLESPVTIYNECPELSQYGSDIKVELLNIYNKVSSQEKSENNEFTKCTNIRMLFQKYYDAYMEAGITKISSSIKINWTSKQNDYYDILSWLQYIFNIPETLIYETNNTIEKRSFVDNFPLSNYSDTEVLKINEYYPVREECVELENDFYRFISTKYIRAPFLFIYFNRLALSDDRRTEVRKQTKIIPSLTIKLIQNKYNLYLNSIIIHEKHTNNSGHYICLYECKGIWYEYNDIKNDIKIIKGGLPNIIINEYYTKNITGLFYC